MSETSTRWSLSNFFVKQSKNHKIKIFVAVGVLLVIIFAGLFFCFFGCHRSEYASSAKLSSAYVAFSQGDKQKGINLLDETIAKYPKMPAAYQARIVRADIFTEAKEYSEALKLLRETVSFGKPAVIKPLANVRIIYVYDSKVDYLNAIDASKEFIDKYPDHFLVKDIYLNLAKYYLILGSKDEAVKVFNEVLVNFPATKEAEKAQTKLNEIKYMQIQ
ncbi:MAG: tetratricopeptide repeat protein [Endomicrobium sp.]|jgi:predicted negative regulator of RcsB-dependent stress response|uniref:tetratricopeptide repeat protein n=1 Tax=Candidatus Endomicrobiellum pyrsonymphae TaxID=1408203 RepID=UPI0035832530|nr:tetratricopeptide repeat protein [Endomicrobium sp.]